ncbi:MFS transporter [Actimicrobium antarcticum]|uniref:Aromatic acid/H+ symport family MFS transporter n=1 Tax=Actimicrobium antarcticum TaxID=1051899 RepID=A0ABP7SKJ0_9BURK
MNSRKTIDISALIDASKISSFQIWLLILVGMTVVTDGFDVLAMAFTAPAIIQEWGINKAALGAVFGAGLFGMLVGSLTFSVLADKIGRRPVLIWCSVFFGVCTLITAQVTTIPELIAIRFIAGLGLGAIMPNAMALAGEFSPKRSRVTLMMYVSCGFTLGSVLGGLLASAMIPAWGWQSVFYLGGVIPLVIATLMFFYVPESLQFMAMKGVKPEILAASLRKIDPTIHIDADTRYVLSEPGKSGTPMLELFHGGRAKATLLLWVVNFMNLLDLYFLSSWIPTIAKSAGMTLQNSVLLGTSLFVGGLIGTLVMGPLIDRIGFYKVLVPAFAVAAVSTALIGQLGGSLPLLFAAVTVTGACIIGGQPGLNALAATYYPTALRSTGIGWSLGIGRFGSIVGPVVGGLLIGLNWSTSAIFIAIAVTAMISAVTLLLMGLETRGKAMKPFGEAASMSH